MNMAYEAIDRHAETAGKKDQVALYYESPDRKESYTFDQLKKMSNQFANVLQEHGVQKGDRVFMFMPRSPEFYASFFGILKVGAVAARYSRHLWSKQ